MALAAAVALLLLGACAAKHGGTVQDPCEAVECSGNGTCFVSGDMPFCDCDDGFHPEVLACTANNTSYACADVRCSGHGTCRVEAGLPVCDCDPGYTHPAQSPLFCFVDPHADALTDPDVEEADEGVDPADVEDVEDEDIVSTCGNGTVEPGEDCDDRRNGDPDDGCTDSCTYTCTLPTDCDDGLPCTACLRRSSR
jgi:cysteine-rich repeat protein